MYYGVLSVLRTLDFNKRQRPANLGGAINKISHISYRLSGIWMLPPVPPRRGSEVLAHIEPPKLPCQ